MHVEVLAAIVVSVLGVVISAVNTFFLLKLFKLKVALTKAQTELAEQSKQNAKESRDLYNNLVHQIETRVNSYLDYFHAFGSSGDFASRQVPLSFGSASNPLLRSEPTLFEYRRTHYAGEKEVICQKFMTTLVSSLRSNGAANNQKLILLIDSGSTVFPIFELLCKHYWDQLGTTGTPKIEIITNNLPGMGALISKGRKGSDINAEMLLECNALPGTLEGKYSAALGPDSVSHLKYLLDYKRAEGNCRVVAVLSGNYISIKDGLLWRGKYHGAMKNAMALLADEVYILSPLGKIFDLGFEEINEIIKSSRNPLFNEKAYLTLTKAETIGILSHCGLESTFINKFLPDCLLKSPNGNGGVKKVSLVTTRRKASTTGSYPIELFEYFSRISALLGQMFAGDTYICDSFSPQTDSEQVIYELKKYSTSPEYAYYSYEFPHYEMRDQMKDRLRR